MLELLFTPEADAFIGDVATSVGSGATAEVTSILAGPIGGIVVFVIALAVIGFVVSVIMSWLGRGRR